MGYQLIEASRAGSYAKEKFLVLNSEVVIELNGHENDHVRKVMKEGISSIKMSADYISLSGISVLNKLQFRSIVNETKSEKEKGAIDNPVENADGEEIFVRLSAFDD